ncbi:Cytochrome P450 4C1 [Formica fusca]
MVFVSVVLIIVVCIAVRYFVLNYHRRRSFKTVNTLPGPRTLPFIGNAHMLLQRSPNDVFNIFTKWAEYYPSPFRIWMGNKLFIFINKSDQIKIVLRNSHCLDKSIVYQFFEPLLGEGILIAPVSKWRQQRKMILPIISNNMLRRFFDIFVEQSLILTDKLENVALNKSEIFFFEYISECTLYTACATLMDIKLKPSSISQFLETMERLKKIAVHRVKNILCPDFIFNFISIRREILKDVNFIHVFIDKIIQQQADTLNKLDIENKRKKNRTLYDILMESPQKEKFVQDDFTKMLHNNTISMLLATSETSAITLNFLVFVLANFSEIQEKVYEELLKIYGTETPKSTSIKYEDLQRMNYLENVIKETMRLFPVVPLIARKLTEDINIGEIILPKGADVVLQLMTMHRNEEYWPNPLVFDPDRFLPENIGTSNSSYMPFSLGSRNCIGMKYAMISLKVLLSILVRTFVFKIDKSIPVDEIKFNYDLMLNFAEPIKIRIEKRDLD